MAALVVGKKAPAVELQTTSGERFSLSAALLKGPVVLSFFKISCPVCQFAFPFIERLFQKAKGTNISIVGISQNSNKDTQVFARQYGITFPLALDNPKGYEVSNAYGITNVPTTFFIAQDGTIKVSSVGWAKDDLLEIARRISDLAQLPRIPVFAANEDVPAFRGG